MKYCRPCQLLQDGFKAYLRTDIFVKADLNKQPSQTFQSQNRATSRQIRHLHGDFARISQVFPSFGWVYPIANSRPAGFVTGIVVPVDGGFSAYSGV